MKVKLSPRKFDVGDIEFRAHAVVAGLGGGITGGIAFGDLALSGDGAGARQDRFEKRGLTREVRTDECDAT